MKKLLFITIMTLLFSVAGITQNYELWSIGIDGLNPKIYKTDSVGENLQWVYTMNPDTEGKRPMAGLFLANNGKLYGTTTQGGPDDNYGTFFEYDIRNSEFTVLVDFNGENGAAPQGNVIEADNGKLYGMTTEGGTSFDTIPPGNYIKCTGWGTLFEYDLSTSSHKILHNFMYEDGILPKANLMQATDGFLYGTTSGGSNTQNRKGTIFKYDIENDTLLVLFSFADTTGGSPFSTLIQASNEKLYGTARTEGKGGSAYGTLFEYDVISRSYTVLHNFYGGNNGYPDGLYPESGLLQAEDGKLYGVTGGGGVPRLSKGVIYSYDINTLTFERQFSFPYSSSVGAWPNSRLIQAANGNLYGTNHNMVYEYDLEKDTLLAKSHGAINTCGLIKVEAYDNTAINEKETGIQQFDLYPNPGNEIVTINYNIPTGNNIVVSVINISGKEVFRRKFSANNQIQLDISEVDNGLYLIRLQSENNYSCKKLIINHY